jgi:DNA mismatch repair ATPase MutS
VSRFLDDQDLRANIVQLLRQCNDSQRLVQKFSLGRGDPEDLIALSRTIEATQSIVAILGGILKDDHTALPADHYVKQPLSDGITCIGELLRRLSLDGPAALASQISKTIDEEGLMRKQRIEESKAADAMAAAQEAMDTGTVGEEKMVILKKGVFKDELNGSRDGGTEFEGVWVMRKRYKSLSSTANP